MKYFSLLVLGLLSFFCSAQNKPRVFVRGKGTINSATQGGRYRDSISGGRWDSIVDSHDESLELTKELRQRCPEIIVTLKESAADFLVMLNRESKMKKGLASKNNQVLVANTNGDVIWTKDVRQVASAAKDVCQAVTNAGIPARTEAAKASTENSDAISPKEADAEQQNANADSNWTQKYWPKQQPKEEQKKSPPK